MTLSNETICYRQLDSRARCRRALQFGLCIVYSAVNAATCYTTIDTGCFLNGGTVQQSSKSLTFLMFGAFLSFKKEPLWERSPARQCCSTAPCRSHHRSGGIEIHFVVKDLVQVKRMRFLADDGWISSLFIRFMELCPISSQPESVQTKTLYFPHLSLETNNKIFF